jgi:hypothetical protein
LFGGKTMKPFLAQDMHDWLLRPLPIEEAEARHTCDGVPFGLQNGKWQELRSMVLADPKLQLWSFCSPPESWTEFPLCGMEGYAVVREDRRLRAYGDQLKRDRRTGKEKVSERKGERKGRKKRVSGTVLTIRLSDS